MDFFSHFLWVFALAYAFFPEGVVAGLAIDLKALFLGSVLPDFSLAPFMAYTLFWAAKGLKEKEIEARAPEWVFSLFYVSHSPFVLGVMFLILAVFSLPIALGLLIGYGSHIIIDYLLHKDRFSLKLLYPFSEKQFKGLTDWYNNYLFYAIACIVLALVYTALWHFKGLTLLEMASIVFF